MSDLDRIGLIETRTVKTAMLYKEEAKNELLH